MVRLFLVFISSFLFVNCLQAELTGVEVSTIHRIDSNSEIQYELVKGRLLFEVDPDNSYNQYVVDLHLAPLNNIGRVSFAADFELLRPMNPNEGNNILIADILNRGSRRAIRYFNFATNYDSPDGPTNLGDDYLMEHGYSILSIGWQFDVPNNPALLRSYVPVIEMDPTQDNGLVRSDFFVTESTSSHTLGDRGHFAYPVNSLFADQATMTIRELYSNEKTTLPRDQWSFIEDNDETANSILSNEGDLNAVVINGGFQPGFVYEVSYPSHRSAVAGLGLAAIRDGVQAIKNHLYIEEYFDNTLEPMTVIAFGDSQSGRTLRTFLYDGFNYSETGEVVIEGFMIHLGSNARGGFNQRYTQASRAVDRNYDYPAEVFPFSDNFSTNHINDQVDGLLSKYEASDYPKIFFSNSATEYWRSPAYLIHTSSDGESDLVPLASSRIFQFSGTQHVPSNNFNWAGDQRFSIGNNAKYQWFLRALLQAMNEWITLEIDPPESRYPNISEGTLIPAESLTLPESIPFVTNTNLNHGFDLDYGSSFQEDLIPSIEPPIRGYRYDLRVSSVNNLGNEIGGLVPWEVFVPLATYTGWFPGNPKSSIGMVIPFTTSNLSLPFIDKNSYLDAVRNYTSNQIEQRYLLAQDQALILREASQLWDILVP